jgi:hypothetical protein
VPSGVKVMPSGWAPTFTTPSSALVAASKNTTWPGADLSGVF